jgi:hypothetical protein
MSVQLMIAFFNPLVKCRFLLSFFIECWIKRHEDQSEADIRLGCMNQPVKRDRNMSSGSEAFGFQDGATSVHTSRTMMLDELTLLLEDVNLGSSFDTYAKAIVDENVLGKSTNTTRQRSLARLSQLYSLDPGNTLFRLLRHFWDLDKASRPMLAFLTAAARDPLLRDSTPFVKSIPLGQEAKTANLIEFLQEKYPNRFRSSTLLSTAQNLASSFTQAGYLQGRVNKRRTKSQITPIIATFALLLGYLCGLRGKLLLESVWTRLLDCSHSELMQAVTEAGRQGWLNYKAVGSIFEITFPGLLKPVEERAGYEQN